jgi:hypothetical protein
MSCCESWWAGIPEAVERLATNWTVRGSDPSGGEIFHIRLQRPWKPGTHPDSYTISTRAFPGVKIPRRGVNHPPSPSAEVKEIVELYIYSPLWAFTACSRMNFTIYIFSAVCVVR